MVACIFAFACPGGAWAKKVYSPLVEEGEFATEYQLDVTVDADPGKNGTSVHQFELGYGVTDRWHTAIYGIFSAKPGRKFRYSAFKWENILQLYPHDAHGVDTGLYLEYLVPAASEKTNQSLELRLLLEKGTVRWRHTLNLNLEKRFGASLKDTDFGFVWSSRWNLSTVFRPGFEAFATFGSLRRLRPLDRQSILVGPVIYGTLRGGLKYEAGYLFGLTRASVDGNVKLNLELEF